MVGIVVDGTSGKLPARSSRSGLSFIGSQLSQPRRHFVVRKATVQVAADPQIVEDVLHGRVGHAAPPDLRRNLVIARPLLERFLIASAVSNEIARPRKANG